MAQRLTKSIKFWTVMTAKKFGLFSFFVLSLFSFRSATEKTAHGNCFHRRLAGNISIVIIKSTYELKVFDEEGWYATYPVVFGSKSLGDKMMEGDRRTRRKALTILHRNAHMKNGIR